MKDKDFIVCPDGFVFREIDRLTAQQITLSGGGHNTLSICAVSEDHVTTEIDEIADFDHFPDHRFGIPVGFLADMVTSLQQFGE